MGTGQECFAVPRPIIQNYLVNVDANAELTHVLTQDYPTFKSAQFQ
jgi:hypothetical protein